MFEAEWIFTGETPSAIHCPSKAELSLNPRIKSASFPCPCGVNAEFPVQSLHQQRPLAFDGIRDCRRAEIGTPNKPVGRHRAVA